MDTHPIHTPAPRATPHTSRAASPVPHAASPALAKGHAPGSAPAQAPLRLTQRELARQLGVSQATVSRALGGNLRHSETTREQVLQTAAQMGYRPDPVLSSLNAYRRTRKPISTAQTLAWFGAERRAGNTFEGRLFTAASAYATTLGYGMEYVWGEDPHIPLARFAKILTARGVDGILFGPRPHPHTRIGLDVSHFASVLIGRSIDSPGVDRVSVDHFQTMELCYRSVLEHGYRRIGFALSEHYSERVAGLWAGAYLLQQLRHSQLPTLPPLLHSATATPQDFARWFEQSRPDAIITMGWEYGCLPHMQELSLRAPQDVGLALIVHPQYDAGFTGFAGITEPVEQIARFAVDILIGRIRNNQRGIPADRRIHLLPGHWRDGASLPRTPEPAAQFGIPPQDATPPPQAISRSTTKRAPHTGLTTPPKTAHDAAPTQAAKMPEPSAPPPMLPEALPDYLL